MKNRIELAKHFHDKGFIVGAEIGVLDGTYAEQLCQNIPGVKLYCVDSWRARPEYTDYTNPKTFSRAHERAQKALKPYGCILVRKLSLDAVKDFSDESLDFVYIDADHTFDAVIQDMVVWTKKVRRGGIVAGHDFHNTNTIGVEDAVRAYCNHHRLDLRITRERDHHQHSWYFPKP